MAINIFNLKARKITTSPVSKSCNISENIVITCYIDLREREKWNSTWIHRVNGKTVRKLEGVTAWNMSSLDINFCDYRDTGDYFCQWTSNRKSYTSMSSVKVIVYGPPICTSKRIRFITEKQLQLTMFVYSIPEPHSVQWITDSNPANPMQFKNSKLHKEMKDISIYGLQVPMELYILSTNIEFNSTYSGNISCIVKNGLGNVDTIFNQDDMVKEYKLFLRSQSTSSGSEEFDIKYIYIILAVMCVLVLVATAGRCFVSFHKKSHGLIVVDQQEPNVTNENQNQSRSFELIEQNTSEYEEIVDLSEESLYGSHANDSNTNEDTINLPTSENNQSYMIVERNYLELVGERLYEDKHSTEATGRSYTVPERPYTDLSSDKNDTNMYNTTTSS